MNSKNEERIRLKTKLVNFEKAVDFLEKVTQIVRECHMPTVSKVRIAGKKIVIRQKVQNVNLKQC